MKFLSGFITFCALLAFAPAGAMAAEETEEQLKARKKAEAEANSVHALSVFSYVNPVRGRVHTRRRPVLITLNVKGMDALSHFCQQKPLIGEAVLKIIGWGPAPDLSNKKVLEIKRQSLHQEFSEVLSADSLKNVSLKLGKTVAEFGKQLQGTSNACGGK